MKVVIFAGGLGTRISEETDTKPKPMIEIGGKPIIWHIMKIYEAHGFNDFIICLGYKGYVIREYFINYFLRNSDATIDLNKNSYEIHQNTSEKFKITLIDTGQDTKTAGRLKRIQNYLDHQTFMLTYGDGVADINLHELVKFHRSHGKLATMSTIQMQSKYGALELSGDLITKFIEKPKDNWVNGGFFVLEPNVLNYLGDDADKIMWEDYPLQKLAEDGQLMAYKHTGFWKCMDALRDKLELEKQWETQPQWKIWQ